MPLSTQNIMLCLQRKDYDRNKTNKNTMTSKYQNIVEKHLLETLSTHTLSLEWFF